MRLLEYESLIKDKIKVQRDDPEIYNLLCQMISMFLQRKKVCKCLQDVEDISCIISGDIFMKIVEGSDFSYFLGYLEKVYRSYIESFYEFSRNEISIDLISESTGALYNKSSHKKYSEINNRVYLEEVGRVVDELMDETCKYVRGSSSYLNLKISLYLSILRKREINFHLSGEEFLYLRLLVIRFYDKVSKEGIDFEGEVSL